LTIADVRNSALTGLRFNRQPSTENINFSPEGQDLKPNQPQADLTAINENTKSNGEAISLEHPETVLTVLEADQLVAAKQRTRFGRRELSWSVKLTLWGLRLYVVIMLLIVLMSVLRVLHRH
jgi:hypothetical protein